MSLLAVIVASGVATYLTRVLPLVVAASPRVPTAVRRWLDGLPTAIIAALAGGATLAPDGFLTRGAEPLGALAAVAVAVWRRNLLLAVIAGVASVAVARVLGL